LNYAQRAAQYADDVISGKQIACDFIVRACERFVRDLQHQDSKSFPFYFDSVEANRACEFLENLPHIKGEWAKKGLLLELENWQCFVVCNIFGWRCVRTITDSDGNVLMHEHTRRFRTVYLEVARKNAKSTLLSGIGLYMLIADGEAGAEIYSAATTHKQAKIVWQDAKLMAEKAAGLRQHFGCDTNAKAVYIKDTAAKFEPLHSQGETLDGLNVHCAINDELHAHKKRDLYDVLETATGSRTQPLILNITTAGTNKSGICYELRLYVVKLMERTITDETFFGVIYTLDKDDNPMDRKTWTKANPNYGVSVYPFDMERLAKKAEESPASMNNFLTKRLNVWCNAEAAWMNMREWDAAADPTLKESDFYDCPLWVGVDLASKIDMNAVVRLYKKRINDETHVYAFPSFYLPEAAVQASSNSQYSGWERRGLITTTPGQIIDMDTIEDDVIELRDDRDLQEVCFDPGHNSTQWAVHCDDNGLDMVEVRPTVMNFSEPMKWWEALVKAGRFHHDGNEIMTWMVSNVVVKYDQKDNIYPRKERNENKIDGPVAVCIGLNRLLASENEDLEPTIMVI
jgi:phage terminase large subunit-like protein